MTLSHILLMFILVRTFFVIAISLDMDELLSINSELDQVSVCTAYTCSPENSSNHLPNSKHTLKVLHINIRSIGNSVNFDSLCILLDRLSFEVDVIILTECWLSKCTIIPKIHGYSSHSSNFNNQNEGVVLYLKNSIRASVEEYQLDESNCLLIKLSNEIAIIAVYRSPSYKNISKFLNSLDRLLPSLQFFKTVALIGDINIHITSETNAGDADKYLNMLASHAMLPGHYLPTRNLNCLDHVILKTDRTAVTLVLDSIFTDHAPVVFFVEYNSDVSNNKRNRTINRLDIAACIRDIENTDFSLVLQDSDAESAAKLLVTLISNSVKSNSRLVSVPSRKRIVKPWITPGLLRCIRHRDKLFRKSRQDPTNVIIAASYKRYKNFCNNLLKKVRREYDRSQFEKNKNSVKGTWKAIREITNLKQKDRSDALLFLSDDPKSSVDAVNRFFIDVGDRSASFSPFQPDCRSEIPQISCQDSMGLFATDESEIDSIIMGLKLNSAVGWDGIPASLLRATRLVMLPILNHVFNLCLTTGVFPSVFKKAVVHPIFKNGDRDSVSNYRPISVLSTFSKIFEKIINKRLICFLDSKQAISANQFGFRAGKSTEDAVLELTGSIVKNLNKKLKSLCMFLDISKAFDTVSVPILLHKLERLGIRGLPLNLFKSYLSGRTQSVTVNGITSDERSVTSGVPQGSVLGPTLFLVFINGLCQLSLPNCKIITYADDTALLVHGQDWEGARKHAEHALRIVTAWLSYNHLLLNLTKTCFVTFAPRLKSQPDNTFKISAHENSCTSVGISSPNCDCFKIQRLNHVKYLGVVVDSVMSWHEHVQSVSSRIRKLIFVFRKLRGSADEGTLKTAYITLAQSILSYCISVWGSSTVTNLIPLERAQRAVLKVMAFKPIWYPTAQLYELWQVLSVRKLFVLSVLLRKHRSCNFDPELALNTRLSNRIFKVEKCSTKLTSRHYLYLSSVLYNKINYKLRFYSLSFRECKQVLCKWLLSLKYEDVESLV